VKNLNDSDLVKFNKLKKTVKGLESRLNEADGRAEALESRIKKLNKKVKSLESQMISDKKIVDEYVLIQKTLMHNLRILMKKSGLEPQRPG